MKEKLKNSFYRWLYLDFTGEYKKENTYFYRFSEEIERSNLLMMRSMSIFMFIISVFVIASTFTYFAEESLRGIYTKIIILESVILVIIQRLIKREHPPRICTMLTAFHLLHMLAIGGYIGVVFCKEETAIIFIVILAISSMIFTLPTAVTMIISTAVTILVIMGSYYYKDSYWFEADTLNSISVLIFSFLFGWKINRVRAEEAFSRDKFIQLNEELRGLSITDQLTGLYNHRSFQDTYYEMFSRSVEKGLLLGIIMMDLDKFKSYNDNYGHVAGDGCLKAVADAIGASLPKGAVACRYGGEEFVVLLDEKLSNDIESIGENVRKAVESLGIVHSYTGLETGVVTVSVGAYAGVPTKSEQPMSFVDEADKAMYQSKMDGRNHLTVILKDVL